MLECTLNGPTCYNAQTLRDQATKSALTLAVWSQCVYTWIHTYKHTYIERFLWRIKAQAHIHIWIPSPTFFLKTPNVRVARNSFVEAEGRIIWAAMCAVHMSCLNLKRTSRRRPVNKSKPLFFPFQIQVPQSWDGLKCSWRSAVFDTWNTWTPKEKSRI